MAFWALGKQFCSIELNLFYQLHRFVRGIFPLSLRHLTSRGIARELRFNWIKVGHFLPHPAQLSLDGFPLRHLIFRMLCAGFFQLPGSVLSR